MHAAAPAALWAARYGYTFAGAALLATFISELRLLASLIGRLAGVRGVRAHEEEADWALVLAHDGESCCQDSRTEREAQRACSFLDLTRSTPKRKLELVAGRAASGS